MHNFGDDLFANLVDTGAVRQLDGLTILKSDRGQIAVESLGRLGRLRPLMRVARVGTNVFDALWTGRVAYAGGSVFSRLSGTKRVFRLLTGIGFVRNLAIGISVGPFSSSSDRKQVGSLLSRCTEVVVRDERSLEQARDLGVSSAVLGGDLVALWPDILMRRVAQHTDSVVTICPCSASAWTAEDYAGAALAAAASTGATRFLVLSLNTHPQLGDGLISAEIHSLLEGMSKACELVKYDAVGLDKTIDLLASSQLVVSGRLHGAVVSYLVGTPFLLVLYHQKCIDFLQDVRLPSGCISAPQTADEISELCVDVVGLPAKEYVARAVAAYGKR